MFSSELGLGDIMQEIPWWPPFAWALEFLNNYFLPGVLEKYLSLQQKDRNYMVFYMCLTLRNCCPNLPDVCIFFSVTDPSLLYTMLLCAKSYFQNGKKRSLCPAQKWRTRHTQSSHNSCNFSFWRLLRLEFLLYYLVYQPRDEVLRSITMYVSYNWHAQWSIFKSNMAQKCMSRPIPFHIWDLALTLKMAIQFFRSKRFLSMSSCNFCLTFG